MKTDKFILILLFATAVSFISCTNGTPKEDTSGAAAAAKERASVVENNKITAQKLTDAFSNGAFDSLANYLKVDFVEHQPNPPGITTNGIQAIKDAYNFYHTAFPDMKMVATSMIAEGDVVVVHINVKGTNSGAMGTMPATNKAVDLNGVDIYRFADGKVIEHWGYFEEGKMMQQLGMMDGPKADAKKK